MPNVFKSLNIQESLHDRIRIIAFHEKITLVEVIRRAVAALEKELAKKAKGGE